MARAKFRVHEADWPMLNRLQHRTGMHFAAILRLVMLLKCDNPAECVKRARQQVSNPNEGDLYFFIVNVN